MRAELVTPTEMHSAFEEYRYDALGRRVLMRSRGEWACDSSCFGQVIRTVWDGDQILREISAPGGSNATAAQMENDQTVTPLQSGWYPYGSVTYTHGPGIDAPLALTRVGYSDSIPGTVRIVPYANWNGRYDGGVGIRCVTIHSSTQIQPDSTSSGSQNGNPSAGNGDWQHCTDVNCPASAMWSTYERKSGAWAGPPVDGKPGAARPRPQRPPLPPQPLLRPRHRPLHAGGSGTSTPSASASSASLREACCSFLPKQSRSVIFKA